MYFLASSCSFDSTRHCHYAVSIRLPTLDSSELNLLSPTPQGVHEKSHCDSLSSSMSSVQNYKGCCLHSFAVFQPSLTFGARNAPFSSSLMLLRCLEYLTFLVQHVYVCLLRQEDQSRSLFCSVRSPEINLALSLYLRLHFCLFLEFLGTSASTTFQLLLSFSTLSLSQETNFLSFFFFLCLPLYSSHLCVKKKKTRPSSGLKCTSNDSDTLESKRNL